MKSKTTCVVFILLLICAVLALLNSADVSVRAKGENPVASNIRLTPPPPVFGDKERVAEQFRKNQVQVLLTTSIVEVGVDGGVVEASEVDQVVARRRR